MSPDKQKFDVHQEITNRIVAAIETPANSVCPGSEAQAARCGAREHRIGQALQRRRLPLAVGDGASPRSI